MPKRPPQRKMDGARLAALMEEHGIKDLPLARAIRVSPSQIKRWKHNERAAMPDNVRALADYFGVAEAYLYGIDTQDVRERLAAELERALGTPEADIVRAFGALSEERRQFYAGKIVGGIELEMTEPLPGRRSPVSMLRRSASPAETKPGPGAETVEPPPPAPEAPRVRTSHTKR